MTLFNIELDYFLYCYPQFRGTFPRDLIPKTIDKSSGVVINTDDHKHKGAHWVAVYVDCNGGAFYFDSFGLPPLFNDIIKFLNHINPQGWSYNTINFQSIWADTCGNYCLYYLTTMFEGEPFEYFRFIFNFRPLINDRLAKILYKCKDKIDEYL